MKNITVLGERKTPNCKTIYHRPADVNMINIAANSITCYLNNELKRTVPRPAYAMLITG